MAIVSKLLLASAAILLAYGQVPATSDMSSTVAMMGYNYFLDYFAFNTTDISTYYIWPYPTEICNLAALSGSKYYVKYSCQSDGSVLKRKYGDSGCTISVGNSTKYTTGSDPALPYSYNCNGDDSSYLVIDAGCSDGTDVDINVVGDTCFYSSTTSASFKWTCYDSDNGGDYDKIGLTYYAGAGTRCNTTTGFNLYSISFDTCATFATTGRMLQASDSSSCPAYTTTTTTTTTMASTTTTTSSGSTTDTTTTEGATSTANYIYSFISLIISFFIISLLQ